MRVKDYVMLSAALAAGGTKEFRNLKGIIPAVRKFGYGFVPPNFKKNSYVSTVSRLLSKKEILKKYDPNGRFIIVLTTRGKKVFDKKFPVLTLANKNWDREFLEVIFDVSEKERATRNILRTKLTELGFGMLQKSVWISPYHFEEILGEYIDNNNLEGNVEVLTVKSSSLTDIKYLAQKVWNLKKINDRYQAIWNSANDLITLEGASLKEVGELWQKYFDVLKDDPLLPKQLLPTDWSREKTVKILSALMSENDR